MGPSQPASRNQATASASAWATGRGRNPSSSRLRRGSKCMVRRVSLTPVMMADRQRWVHDEDGSTSASEAKGVAFGQPFGAAVGTKYVGQRHLLILGDRPALPDAREDAFGTGVQDARHPGGEGRVEHVDGAEVI